MVHVINHYLLMAVLAVAVYFDLTAKKIPNRLTFPVILWGLCSYAAAEGVEGLLFALQGAAVGFLVLIIPHLMGGIGGGDVKLLAAVGALKGTPFIVEAAVYSALAGGFLALAFLIVYGRLGATLRMIGGKLSAGLRAVLPLAWPGLLLADEGAGDAEALPASAGEEGAPISIPYGLAIGLGSAVVILMG